MHLLKCLKHLSLLVILKLLKRELFKVQLVIHTVGMEPIDIEDIPVTCRYIRMFSASPKPKMRRIKLVITANNSENMLCRGE